MITRKQISKAIFDKLGVNVELDKFQGIYYWYDPLDVKEEDMICTLFQSSCTHMRRLNDFDFLEDQKLNITEFGLNDTIVLGGKNG